VARVGADGIFRRVKVRIWRSGSFSRLSPVQASGQALWLYLLTCPESCAIPGAIVAGRAQLAEALAWPLQDFDRCYAEVAAEGMSVADWGARLVWLPRGLYENPPANPNIVKSWAPVFRTLPDCHLKARIYRDLQEFTKAFGKGFAEAFSEAFGKAFRKGFAPSGGTKGVGSREEGVEIPPPAATQPSPPGGTTTADTEPEFPPQDAEPIPDPKANAYPWHPDDEREFGDAEQPHGRWRDYVEWHMAKRTAPPWPRFVAWLSEDVKQRADVAKRNPADVAKRPTPKREETPDAPPV
jgi:hypothetical protein